MVNQTDNFLQIIDTRVKKDLNDDSLAKTTNAAVISYNPQNKECVVGFVDDSQNNSYTLYNKSGEVLSEGDTVKVYYTTNPAKGWIGIRIGEPNIEEVDSDCKKIIVQSNNYFEKTDWDCVSSGGYDSKYPTLLPKSLDIGDIKLSLSPSYYSGYPVKGSTVFAFNGYIEGGTPLSVTLRAFETTYFDDEGAYVRSDWTIYSNGEQSFKYGSTIKNDGGTWYFNYDTVKLINNKYCVALKDLWIDSNPSEYSYPNYSGFRGIFVEVPSWENQLGREDKLDTNKSFLKNEIYFDNPFIIKLKHFKGNISLPNLETETVSYPLKYDWGDGEISFGDWTHSYKSEGYYTISVLCKMNSARRTLWGSSMSDMYECNAKNNIHMITFPKFLDSIDFPNLVAGSTMLETVWLSSTATYVNMSFKNCTALQVCPLPPNIVTLGEDTSFRNTAIQKVTLPKSLVAMPDYLYADCHSLKSVVTSCSIGNHIFDGCENLTSLSFSLSTGQTITIGESAFYNCKNLSSITFPSGVSEIGHLAFAGTGLTKVSLGNSTSYYSDSFPPECKVSGGILIS